MSFVGRPLPDNIEFGSSTVDGDHVQHVAHVHGNREFGAFYNLRSQRYIATTDYVSVALNGDVNMAAARNPTGSGRWCFMDVLEFGSVGATGRFRRYGGSPTFSVTGAKQAVGKTDGSSLGAGEGILEVYRADATGYSASGGTVRKVAPMGDARPYVVNAFGSLILRPGQVTYWKTNEIPPGGAGTYDTYINFEWVEMPEADAATLVTNVQALPG